MSVKMARAVTAVNGAVAAALVAVLAAVALVVRPPAPPGIAEFAPKAAKPITKAPLGQQAQAGNGPGACMQPGCAPSGRPAVPTPSVLPQPEETLGVPAGLQCYRWSNGVVTQTFDPQSPPCIAAWPDSDRGNGGATAQGVTRSTITVAVPGLTRDVDGARRMRDIATFINNTFQLYGRKLRLVDIPTDPAAAPCSGSAQNSLAARALAQHPFASTQLTRVCDNKTYRDKLIQGRVISVSDQTSGLLATEMASRQPYEWSYSPPIDQVERHFVEFACKSLRGNARYGGVDVATKARRFVILRRPETPAIPVGPVVDGLGGCFGERPTVIDYEPDFRACVTNTDTQSQQLMLKLRREGVTTIVDVGANLVCAQTAARSLSYQPEWAVLPVAATDYYEGTLGGPADMSSQLSHMYGLAPANKWLALPEEPIFRVIATVDPSAPRSGNGLQEERQLYRQLLLLASGVQMAGPHLTPATLEEALQSTAFPNPGAGASPTYQATVDFSAGDHTMVRDVGVWWWSTTTKSPSNPLSGSGGTGGFCYVQRGSRYSLGSWPRNLVLQDEKTCR